MTETEQKLCAAIEEIYAKATPYGSTEERGSEWVTSYILPCGPLHRAYGLVTCLRSNVMSEKKETPSRFRRVLDWVEWGFDIVVGHPLAWAWHGLRGCPPQDVITDFARDSGMKIRYCVVCNRVHGAFYGGPHA